MPNVPKAPGVPALTSYAATSIPLILSDAVEVLSIIQPAKWGIYFSDTGEPVLTPESMLTSLAASTLSAIGTLASLAGFSNIIPVITSTVSFEINAESPVSNAPQEDGAFVSYDKVTLPPIVQMAISCSGSPIQRQQFENTLEALRSAPVLVDLVTPEKTFTDYTLTRYGIRRRAEQGVTLLVAHCKFDFIPISAGVAFSNTQQPGNAGAQSNGNVQPQDVPTSFSTRFEALGRSS